MSNALKKNQALPVAPVSALEAPNSPNPTPESPVDWERAFVALAILTSTSFVSSHEVSHRVNFLRDKVDPRAAELLSKIFNKTRTPWMQGFMG
jgi:hypothetical protein